MKLYGSLTSPFVRTVRIAAIELGLGDQVVLTPTIVRPTQPNRDYGARVNPLRRVPALETDEGEIFIDSRVIAEFLNKAAKGAVVPKGAAARIACFNRHAAIAGATEALVSAMYETRLRPEERRWPEWAADQIDKAGAVLDWVETRIVDFAANFDLAAIALVCLTDYAQFRFASIDWLAKRPGLAAFAETSGKRPSVAATAPRE
ncbi:MAG TPA: glutathione S-transferase [Parvularcula sp.]|nr:glutathione S-transferase [Parvularcula sp.]HBS33796.1 glutathione S-transferase [Parvularcula sp.]